MNKCEFHINCEEEVVARIGLPSKKAVWTCERGFWEWQRQEEGEVKSGN